MKKKIIGLIDGQSGNIGSIKKAIKDIVKDKPYQLKIIQSQFDPNQFSKIVLIAFLLQNLTNDLIYSPDASLFLFVCISYLVSGYYSSISRFSLAKS